MGVGGMFVQGVLVRVINGSLGEQRTLVLAMACTSLGYAGLAAVASVASLVPCLGLVSLGYGLAVPCISTLFSHVPVEQGVMQGLAGSIDRFGQVFGPVVGGWLLEEAGMETLMVSTGGCLAIVSAVCLCLVVDETSAWVRRRGACGAAVDCACAALLCQWSRLPLFGPSYTEVPSEEDEEGGEGTALLQDSQREGSEGGGSPRASAR